MRVDHVVSDQSIFSLSDSVSFQPLGDGEGAVVLLIETGDIFTCNDTTAAFLRTVDGKRTFSQAVEDLAGEFDVERSRLRSDLEVLAESLMKEGIIV